MSKIDSPSSNNSMTSSETSETQSVEENISARSEGQATKNVSIDRTPKKSKRMKDPNDDKEQKNEKKPPWRAVSLSTLPKPDKNALLKAKLLDASRRLRQGRSTIAVQTDIFPTKLMKDVNLGTQVDLILHREASVMTDGSYMKRKENCDEFILTYAVSTLTDNIQYMNTGTQTLLYKLPEDDFMKAYLECDLNAINSKNFTETQRKLVQQICKIKKKTKFEDFIEPTKGCKNENTQLMLRNYAQNSFLSTPTLKSWHFELDEIDNEIRNFQPYTINSQKPWQSFEPLLLNGLYSDAIVNHRLDWNILLIAIDELIQESNNLVDIIEDLSRSKNKVVKPQKFKHEPLKLPSEHWLPIIEEQENKLDAMINQMQKSGKTSAELD